MKTLSTMPIASIIVICMILTLFAIAVVMLFSVCAAYRRQTKLASLGDTVRSKLMHDCLEDFTEAYQAFGAETNTPAIISGAIHRHLGFALFCERFLSNAVSLFVTLGLFGTFLGLSMSVTSLTELLGLSNSAEWLSVLNSVGGGLMSALSGMGVAFYTSLFGVACSIVLTILRAILSPDAGRAALENEMELWLDHRVAPRLDSGKAKDDSELVNRMVKGLNAATAAMDKSLRDTTAALNVTMDNFNRTVASFNQGVRDFSEFDYNLRGTVERLDLAVRDFGSALRQTTRTLERGDRE